MTTNKMKYRVNLYLGRELYEQLQSLSEVMGLPLATTTRLILNTGMELSKALENQTRSVSNGK